jgi:hypothetical protein
VILLLDGSQKYDADLLDKCGAYPEWDQTSANAAGAKGDVPINHLWPDNGGPGGACFASAKDNQSHADQIQGFPLSPKYGTENSSLGTSPTLLDFRTVNGTNNPSIPFMQAQKQYTLDEARVVATLIEPKCGTLLATEAKFFEDLRLPVLTADGSEFGKWSSGLDWGDYLNIVIGDGVDNQYIKAIAEMNSLPTRSCQVTDPTTNPPKYAPCG